jgi:hypothetical protein
MRGLTSYPTLVAFGALAVASCNNADESSAPRYKQATEVSKTGSWSTRRSRIGIPARYTVAPGSATGTCPPPTSRPSATARPSPSARRATTR